uniref:Uncharacterized protein n=1 Tax=Anguilla anguilla TaxID=7936 RepID=A0A0E9WN29_ANGAN
MTESTPMCFFELEYTVCVYTYVYTCLSLYLIIEWLINELICIIITQNKHSTKKSTTKK